MVILGIWDGHDAGAALVVGGRLVAAVNEERFTRRKLEIRFPVHSIECCLQIANLTASDVNLVVGCTSDIAKTLARWFPQLKEDYHLIRRRKLAPTRFAAYRKQAKYRLTEWAGNRLTHRLSAQALRKNLSQVGLRSAQVELLDHHECHAHAAAWGSGYRQCAVLTVDGVGDGLSSTISAFVDGSLTRVAASPARDSLGVFFEHVTNLLNMRELEDEGKVMALADYAAPVPDHLNPLLSMFAVRNGRLNATVPGHKMISRLRSVQWHWPNEQFAYMAQRTVEEFCVQLARDAVRLTGLDKIAMAGGVASNIKANRRIRLLPEVGDLYVFPHMGDGGLAVGAAIAGAAARDRIAGNLSDLELGPQFSDDAIGCALHRAGIPATQPDNVVECVADLLVRGKVVIWYQGRMEYGPRALGCRSVLARPDHPELRERLNLVLKQRVWYQPFCPSMLEAEASRMLMDYTSPSNRFMTMAYLVAPEFRAALAGVTSVDGSCRPQVVQDNASGLFADLLRAMKARTGVGVVLNTSANIHGEPLVCTPAEAIEMYVRTRADALAIGSYFAVSR